MARYLADGAKQVPDGWAYVSDTNPEQLCAETLKVMMGDAKAA